VPLHQKSPRRPAHEMLFLRRHARLRQRRLILARGTRPYFDEHQRFPIVADRSISPFTSRGTSSAPQKHIHASANTNRQTFRHALHAAAPFLLRRQTILRSHSVRARQFTVSKIIREKIAMAFPASLCQALASLL